MTGFKVHEFLQKNHVPFEVVDHPKSFTAMETAVAEHTSPKAFAKAVMAKVDGKDSMRNLNCRKRW